MDSDQNSNMSGVALHGDGDNGEDDSDAKVVGNAGEDDKDNQIGQDMESDDDDDDEGNDDGDDDEDKIVHEAAKVKKDNNSTVKESKAKEPMSVPPYEITEQANLIGEN